MSRKKGLLWQYLLPAVSLLLLLLLGLAEIIPTLPTSGIALRAAPKSRPAGNTSAGISPAQPYATFALLRAGSVGTAIVA